MKDHTPSAAAIFIALFSIVTCHPASDPAYSNNQYTQAIPTIQYKAQQRPVYENRQEGGRQYYQSQNAIQTHAQPVASLVLPAQVAPGHKTGIQTQGASIGSLILPAQIAPGHVQPQQQQQQQHQTKSQPIHKLLLGGRINPDLLRPQPEPERPPQNPAPAFYEQVLKAQQAAQASFRQSAQQVQQQIEAAQKAQAARQQAEAQQQQKQQPLYYQPQPIRYAQPQPQQVKYVPRPVEQPVQQQLYSSRIPQETPEKEDEGDFDHNPSYQFGFDVKDDQYTNYQQRKEQRDGEVIKGSYSVVDADGYIRTVQYTADPKEGFKAEVTREPTNIQILQPKPQEQQYQQPQYQHQQPQPQAQNYRPQYLRPQQRSAPDDNDYRYQQQ